MTGRAVALALALLLAACGAAGSRSVSTASPGSGVAAPANPVYIGRLPSPGACPLLGNTWPNPACTKGAFNPDVMEPCTEAPCQGSGRGNIDQTICKSGWVEAELNRLFPTAESDKVKAALMRAEGLSGPASQYQLNHYLAVADGGSPNDLTNLWVLPEAGISGAHEKEVEDNQLHQRICSGSLSVDEALTQIRTDWSPVE